MPKITLFEGPTFEPGDDGLSVGKTSSESEEKIAGTEKKKSTKFANAKPAEGR